MVDFIANYRCSGEDFHESTFSVTWLNFRILNKIYSNYCITPLKLVKYRIATSTYASLNVQFAKELVLIRASLKRGRAMLSVNWLEFSTHTQTRMHASNYTNGKFDLYGHNGSYEKILSSCLGRSNQSRIQEGAPISTKAYYSEDRSGSFNLLVYCLLFCIFYILSHKSHFLLFALNVDR